MADAPSLSMSRDGLVGYDAALTRLRSRVRFPVFVLNFYPFYPQSTGSRVYDVSNFVSPPLAAFFLTENFLFG
eukprot:scaffold1185_cov108-Skeletonema_marinoi.AAC.1